MAKDAGLAAPQHASTHLGYEKDCREVISPLVSDILAQAEFRLRVANDIRKMDPVLFHAPPIKLELRPAEEMAL